MCMMCVLLGAHIRVQEQEKIQVLCKVHKRS